MIKITKKNIFYFCCISAVVILKVGTIISAMLMEKLIDYPTFDTIIKLAIIWLISALIINLKSYYYKTYYLTEEKNYAKTLLKAIFSFSLPFLESKDYNDELNNVKRKVSQEQEYMTSLENLTSTIIGILGIYLLLFKKVDFSILALITFFLAIIILITVIIHSKLSTLMYSYWKTYIQNTRKYNYISDVMTKKEYVEEKKMFSYSTFFTDEFSKEFDYASDKNKALGKKRIKLEFATNLVFLIYSIFVFLLLYYAYYQNQITIGLFISASGYMMLLLIDINNSVGSIENITRYKALRKDYFSFMQNTEARPDEKNINTLSDSIVMKVENLKFSYAQNNKPVLSGINLTFENGKKYAIVGVNGSGKTTLAKIIAGLYPPESGFISSRSKPVILFQDFNRYPMTLKENITLNEIENDDLNNKKIIEIEEKAGLLKRISKMKNGDNTELTTLKENGEELSGGEWQRLALARILYRDADIYILDEPTANLDPLEEIRIFETYNELLKDKTVIYITHRLGFLKNVDEVIVLNNGVATEIGSHEELLKQQNSIYKKMFEEQRMWYE